MKNYKKPLEDWSIIDVVVFCVLLIAAVILLLFGICYSLASCSPYLSLY